MAKFMIGFSGCKSTIILYFTVHLQQWKWSYCSSFLLLLHQLLLFNMELNFRYRTRSNGCGEKLFFLGRRFLLLIEFKFHHTMLVLKAFLAISEGLVSDNQSYPLPPPLLRDLPLRSHLVLLLVRSHHPVKNIWLCFCFKVKTEQQNQSRSLQNDTGIQNTAKIVALQ